MPATHSPRILVIGANGQVGRALVDELSPMADIVAVTRSTSPAFDLSDPDSLGEKIQAIQPDVVINAAAYTAVDKAESESELATVINGLAPGKIAESCAALEIPLVHYSTDYVFDGSKADAYTEDDAPCPVSAYGKSKLEGEQRIQAQGGQYYVLRTSWVYDHQGQNFLKTMLRLGQDRDQLSVVDDQQGSPTWAGYIAQQTGILVRMLCNDAHDPESGIYHLTCSESTTWYKFAEAIFDMSLERGLIERKPQLSPIPTEAYPTPAARPKNSVLDNDKARRLLHTDAMPWQDALHYCLEALQSHGQ